MEVQKNAIINVGDDVVTSGFSNIYPKNLPIGSVTGIVDQLGSFDKIVMVQIQEDIESLLDVFVVLEDIHETK